VIYNGAGEVVKNIGGVMIRNKDADVLLVSQTGTEDVYYPADGEMTIRITGQGENGDEYVDFKWDGSNNNGQDVAAGAYFVKVNIRDTYGAAYAVVKEVQVIKVEEYVRVTIFNSAGEIVKRVEMPKTGSNIIDLKADDTFYVDGSSSSTTIKIGDNGNLNWDGKNSLGTLVSTGAYEIQVEIRSADGYTVTARRTITVLNNNQGGIISDVKAFPNPYVTAKGNDGIIRISWTALSQGRVKIRIYNVAGELVSRLDAKLSDTYADWNVTARDGSRLASAYLTAVIEAVNDNGAIERRIIKLAIIRKF